MKNVQFVKIGLMCLALAACISSFAQSSSDMSIGNQISNDAAVNNSMPTPVSAAKKSSGGSEADSNGDKNSNCHTGSKGRGAGGNDKGDGCGTPPPGCVPEPASMLALGVGSLIVGIKKRRQSKV